jgi:hypothetical protein
MKSKAMVFIIGCMFLLGMAGNVMAVSDTTGEPLNSGIDIASVSLVTSNIGSGFPRTANIGVEAAPGTSLPALLLFDVDIDNDTTTGGGSVITGIPTAACGGSQCKADVGGGFDFTVTLILRGQDDGTSISNCNGCEGGNIQCTTRGAPVSCTEGTCYELGASCGVGDPDCYISQNPCSCGAGVFAYELVTPCVAGAESCSRGYRAGEWRVGFGQGGQVLNGNFNVDTSYSPFNEQSICVELPWDAIVTAAYLRILAAADPDHPVFNINDALALAAVGPKYQVTALSNVEVPWSGTDFTEPFGSCSVVPGFCLAARDWVPDTDRVADGEYNVNSPCGHNTAGGYGDQNVAADDVQDFLAEFGRSTFNKPCPTCKK